MFNSCAFIETKMNGIIMWSGSKTPYMPRRKKGMNGIVIGYLTGARHLLGQVRDTSTLLHIFNINVNIHFYFSCWTSSERDDVL